ncbi:MAG: D-alanyl-D-alanine carboxypeptidase family protein [Tetrasphaera sp.]
MSVRKRLVSTVVLAAAALVVGPCLSAAADTSSPPPSSPFASNTSGNSSATSSSTSPTGSGSEGPAGEPRLSPEELAKQIARAGELRDQLLAANKDLAAVLAKLDKAVKKANAALEAYSTAKAAAQEATAEAARQDDIAQAFQERLDKARDGLREWAVNAYTQGGEWADALSFLDALGKDANEASNPLNDLNYLTDNQIRSVEELREITVQQKLASMKRDEAREKATKEAAKAKKAKIAANETVEALHKQQSEIQKTNQDALAEAGPLATMLLGSGDPGAEDAAMALSAALKSANVDVSDLKLTPCTDKTGTWPNGQIPPSALCPLVGSADEFLIPDAAAAFNAMSKAYAEETGSFICVTDGYRSYAEQVAIKAIRGPWAATPGTSEHGLGKAVDLGCGINDYSNPAHLWMQRNAPLYGWFHPSWAAQGGTLPEPWHWEFAG